MIGLMRNGGSVDVYLRGEYGLSSAAILGNGCGIQGQNYVAWL